MTLLRHLGERQTRTNQVSIDAKLGELKHRLGMLGGVDLRGRMDVHHGWRVGGGEVRGGRGYELEGEHGPRFIYICGPVRILV